MLRFRLVILFLAAGFVAIAQTYDPAPHQQLHQLPRGAYVACIDDLLGDLVKGNNQKYLELKQTIVRHNLDFVAFYGLHFVVNNQPIDNQREGQLRFVLNDLHLIEVKCWDCR